jgi:hypothetical protein
MRTSDRRLAPSSHPLKTPSRANWRDGCVSRQYELLCTAVRIPGTAGGFTLGMPAVKMDSAGAMPRSLQSQTRPKGRTRVPPGCLRQILGAPESRMAAEPGRDRLRNVDALAHQRIRTGRHAERDDARPRIGYVVLAAIDRTAGTNLRRRLI